MVALGVHVPTSAGCWSLCRPQFTEQWKMTPVESTKQELRLKKWTNDGGGLFSRLLFPQHSDHSPGEHLQSKSRFALHRVEEKKKSISVWKAEFGAGSPHARFHPALVWSCLNGTGCFTSGCPQNNALLRKQQQQQPRQRACWRRRRRTDSKYPFQQPVSTVRASPGQIITCSAVPVFSRCAFGF